jgi:hypothetical protein
MARQLVEHVVEEADAGRDVDLPVPSTSTATEISVSLVLRLTSACDGLAGIFVDPAGRVRRPPSNSMLCGIASNVRPAQAGAADLQSLRGHAYIGRNITRTRGSPCRDPRAIGELHVE